MSACIVAEVGKFYMVPCLQVHENSVVAWIPPTRWVPVLGPKHTDAEYLEFEVEHYHIDWRFIPERQFMAAQDRGSGSVLSSVLSDTEGDYNPRRIAKTPVLRRLKCRREMPTFPQAHSAARVTRSWIATPASVRWARLERAQAFTCNKLKPGNICPHRGIDLTPFIKEDGTVICPGHGLRWDTKTGDLLPYQAPGSPQSVMEARREGGGGEQR